MFIMWLASLRRRLRCQTVSLLICFFMSCIPLRAQDVRSSLDKIPLREQVLLENLFSFFVQWDQLSHVLFFETKPVCFSGIPIKCDYSITPPCISKDPLNFQETLSQGWSAWKKYEYLFPHPNFLICEEMRQIKKGEQCGTIVDVFFINKTSLLSYLNKHQHIFEKELGKNFSPVSFLSGIRSVGVTKLISKCITVGHETNL